MVQALLYGGIAWLSSAFAYGTNGQDRTILSVLALFAASFVLYLAALRVAVRCPPGWRLGAAITVPAIVFRCMLLPTPLIQETDIYRYLWDGAVSARGLNPYRYAPAQVSAADSEDDLSEELRAFVQLRDSSPAMTGLLGRIHYADLTTVYPPVGQAIFAVGDWLMPHGASAATRVVILKSLLTTFDVATIALVWLLLNATGKHPGWVVAYAWCPLVMKEFANTGHLDSIAVFLTTAAVLCVGWPFADRSARIGAIRLLAGAVLLALAIGAKLYPVVLLPLLFAAVAARIRLSTAVMFASFAVLLATACLAPVLLTTPASVSEHRSLRQETALPSETAIESDTVTDETNAPISTSGLKAFMTRWEMNDFLFMILVENLRPVAQNSQAPTAWFAATPNAWREAVTLPVANVLGTDVATAAFILTRMATLCIFLAIALVLAWRVFRHPNATTLVEAAFLTLAWFWLLSPTQNPWYWIWALPLLPFARDRAWYAMSGLVMLYYLRFWLHYQFPNGPIFGTGYDGAQFFDFVVTWLEYAPWYAWLGIAALQRRPRAVSDPNGSRQYVGGFTDISGESTYDGSGIRNQ